MIRTKNIHRDSPVRQRRYVRSYEFASTTSVTGLNLGVCAGRNGEKIVNIVFSQSLAGGGGTSVTAVVKKNGTTVCSTEGLLARTDGDNATVDAQSYLATKPAGATRPVLKTDGTANLAFGDDLTLDLTTAGTYSGTFPKVCVTVVTEGLVD